MSAFRDELNRRLDAWRAENPDSKGCPKETREEIARLSRAAVGPPVLGLAALPPERRAEISAQGGRAAHAAGTAYAFTPEKAREAGKLGGAAAHQRGVAHRFTPDEARAANLQVGARVAMNE